MTPNINPNEEETVTWKIAEQMAFSAWCRQHGKEEETASAAEWETVPWRLDAVRMVLNLNDMYSVRAVDKHMRLAVQTLAKETENLAQRVRASSATENLYGILYTPRAAEDVIPSQALISALMHRAPEYLPLKDMFYDPATAVGVVRMIERILLRTDMARLYGYNLATLVAPGETDVWTLSSQVAAASPAQRIQALLATWDAVDLQKTSAIEAPNGDPWARGQAAIEAGDAWDSCPYPEESQERAQWLSGYSGGPRSEAVQSHIPAAAWAPTDPMPSELRVMAHRVWMAVYPQRTRWNKLDASTQEEWIHFVEKSRKLLWPNQGVPQGTAYLVGQEGGASGEFYPYLFDSLEHAEEYLDSADSAGYNTTTPVAVPENLARDANFLAVVGAVMRATFELQ